MKYRNKMSKMLIAEGILFLLLFMLGQGAQAQGQPPPLGLSFGVSSGDVTFHSAIVWARTTGRAAGTRSLKDLCHTRERQSESKLSHSQRTQARLFEVHSQLSGIPKWESRLSGNLPPAAPVPNAQDFETL